MAGTLTATACTRAHVMEVTLDSTSGIFYQDLIVALAFSSKGGTSTVTRVVPPSTFPDPHALVGSATVLVSLSDLGASSWSAYGSVGVSTSGALQLNASPIRQPR